MSTVTPRVTAAAIRDAAGRLLGAVVLDLADLSVGPARYLPRLAAFATIDGDDMLGDDDGTLVVLIHPGEAADLIARHGTAGAAAAAVNRELRAVGVL